MKVRHQQYRGQQRPGQFIEQVSFYQNESMFSKSLGKKRALRDYFCFDPLCFLPFLCVDCGIVKFGYPTTAVDFTFASSAPKSFSHKKWHRLPFKNEHILLSIFFFYYIQSAVIVRHLVGRTFARRGCPLSCLFGGHGKVTLRLALSEHRAWHGNNTLGRTKLGCGHRRKTPIFSKFCGIPFAFNFGRPDLRIRAQLQDGNTGFCYLIVFCFFLYSNNH